MRFLADENFPGSVVTELAKRGHDIIWVRSFSPGMKDNDILVRVVRDHRILLTFDKDFGEIAFNANVPPVCGIVLFRLPMPPPSEVASRFAAALEACDDWVGNFSVIEAGRVRLRPLKPLTPRADTPLP
jgi:predicted nuclease of predicted toxin-antitoxin system